MFISNGWMADVVAVVAVTDPEAKSAAHGIGLFLVENGTKGFHKGRKLEKIGLKAQVGEPLSTCERTPRLTLLSHSLMFLFFQRTRLSCSLKTCGSQAKPSWGKPTKDFTT